MKMRFIICLSMLLLLVPTTSGFFVEETDGIPQGYLRSGELQKIDSILGFPGLDPLSFPSGDVLELRTDLLDPVWSVVLVRSGGENTLRQSSKSREIISGWELSYPASEDVSLVIRLEGVVPGVADETMVSIISVRQLDGSYLPREGNTYSISQKAYPLGSIPTVAPPDPVIIAPPPPDLSAFSVSIRSTTPDHDLPSGDTATLRTYLSFDRLSATTFPETDTLRFRTALLDAKWTFSIIRNGAATERLPSKGYYYTIPGFELSYPSRESLGLSVAVTGTVPNGSTKPLLEINQCGPDGYTREGAAFIHPAGISVAEVTPAPTQIPTPTEMQLVTHTSTPTQTMTFVPLPPPPKGEVFPDGVTVETVLSLSFELIEHGTLFLKRILSIFGV